MLTSPGKKREREDEVDNSGKDSMPIGWPNFSRVFLVSALTGKKIVLKNSMK